MTSIKLLFPLVLIFSSHLAQAASIERTSAITAFDEAKVLMDQGKVAAACSKFQESYELDAQLGSLLHLADCREQNGQLASAWGHFLNALEWAEKQGDERAPLAKERAEQLAPRVSYITLKFERDLPASAVVLHNDVNVPKALWNRRIPVDSGKSSLSVSADGYDTWTTTVSVSGEGKTTRVDIPALNQSDRNADSNQASSPASRSLMARKWPAVVAAGIGVAGGVVWGVFGTQSMKAKSDADDLCGKGFRCVDADGTDLRQEAYNAGTIATIGAIVTGVGLGAAGVLWLVLPGSGNAKKESALALSPTDPAGPTTRWEIGVRLGGATLVGHF